MTLTEGLAIGGGLLLGYWLISVFLPSLGDADNPEAAEWQAAEDVGKDRVHPGGRQDHGTGRPAAPHWWDVLEVAPDASAEQIAAAYKVKISHYHPDKVAKMGQEIRDVAEAMSKKINAAYEAGSTAKRQGQPADAAS